MPLAACHQDPIEHSHVVNGLLLGAAAGLAIGAIIVIGVGTGGVGLVVGAALLGAGAGELIFSLDATRESIGGVETGMISSGSRDVFIHHKAAVRAVEDVVDCAGTPPLYLPSHVLKRVAEGSETVSINALPAVRIGDRIECGAVITDSIAVEYVIIGGRTVQALEIDDEVPGWLRGVMIGVAIMTWGPIMVGVSLIGGVIGETSFRWAAEKLGASQDQQKIAGFIGGFLGSWLAGARVGQPLANWAGRAIPARFPGSSRAVKIGGFLRGGLPGMRAFPSDGPASEKAVQNVLDAMDEIGVGKSHGRNVSAFVDENGKTTVSFSGDAAEAQGIWERIEGKLPDYEFSAGHNLELIEVAGHEHYRCTEPKLSEAMKGKDGELTSRYRGRKPSQHQVSTTDDHMPPCTKCRTNMHVIMQPELAAPPLACPLIHAGAEDHEDHVEHVEP